MYGTSEISQVYQKGGLGVSGVTQPFFELKTPEFAWKFVWTVPKNFEQKIVRGFRRGVRDVQARGGSWASRIFSTFFKVSKFFKIYILCNFYII